MKNYLLLISVLFSISMPAFAQQSAPVQATLASPAPVPIPATPPKAAPDIQQQINTALIEYQKKNYGKSADALDAASSQLRKLKSDALAQFLPAAPKGWTAKEEQNRMIGIPSFGSVAERTYLSGGEELKIIITANSMLMASMRRGPAIAQSIQFLGHNYIFKTGVPTIPEMVRKNEAILSVGNNLTISVSGKQITDQQAREFLGLIDLDKLKIEADK